jgi:tRNA 2-thiouridine synthesizing protein A
MPLIEIATYVDARGLQCPMPIVNTAQAIKSIPSGAHLELISTDRGSVKDVAAWCRTTGNELIDQSIDGSEFRFVIRKQ